MNNCWMTNKAMQRTAGGQLFICMHNEPLSVVAMRVCNPNRTPVPPSIRAALA